jgi:hypothetical protein
MPRVQRSHRGHQRDAEPGCALAIGERLELPDGSNDLHGIDPSA